MRTEQTAPRYAGTEPLTEEMLNSMFGRECDGSYTDPWESLEGVHGCCARQYVGRHPLGLPDTLAGLL
jgi:hypothetical protein